MDLFNKLVNTLGDPALLGITVLLVFIFGFQQKKPMYAIYSIFGAAMVYYVMHNLLTVLQMFGGAAKAILDFFVSLF